MTLYNPITDTSPANPALATDNSAYIFGLFFTVSSACQINGVWWYCNVAGTQYRNANNDESVGLYSVASGGVHTLITQNLTGITYAQGWNLLPFTSPVALTPGVEYDAAKGISAIGTGGGSSNNYCATSQFFGAVGNPGTNGYSEGPVLVYSSGASGFSGVSNNEPNGLSQQTFYMGSTNSAPPSMGANYPNTGFHSTWYGMDIQIQTSGSSTTTTYQMRRIGH